MPTPAAVILVLIALVVAGLGWRSPIQLWHVIVLGVISLVLILWTSLDRHDIRWVIFGLGLGIGIFSLVRSYQYQGRISEEHRQQVEQEWEELWEAERAEEEATGRRDFLPRDPKDR